jgi:phage repressor protein C with HTH and peptisase S24 domain
MQTYGQRVKMAREHADLSQGKLAKILGIKQPTLHAIETKSKAKGSKHTLAIARATGVNLEWLETGDGQLSASPQSPDQGREQLTTPEINVAAMPRDLPILGCGACGEGGLFDFNGQTLDFARRPARLAGIKDAYALYVSGESMAPWREHGDLVYVHPHQPVKIGDYVVVQMMPTSSAGTIGAYIKKLLRRTASEVQLLQFNPREELKIPTKRIGAIHRIVDWSELMGI